MKRVGINTIKKFVAEITTALGDDSCYTNHYLRARSVSHMYNAGIREKVISKKSGHKSIEGLCAYERISDELEGMAKRSTAGEPSGALCEVKKVKEP
uniref:Tyr recombinase domain-containing protein n=1 Tax=Amphimedon queenslandica TaxID=400682 RepID=A0A1X7U6E6_AMPQE